MKKNNPKLSIIIPTLNEEEGIAKVICSIPEEIRKISEVIVVDFSDDFTPIIAKRLGAEVLRGDKKGKGRQMRQAVKKSKGEILVFLDGDGTDPADFIPKLLEKLEKSNIVLGCRNSGKLDIKKPKIYEKLDFFGRKLSGKFYAYMFGLKVFDPLAGFRAIRRKDWDALNLKSDGFEIETEMNIKAMKNHFKIEQVLLPNLRRSGGVTASKFLLSPKSIIKVIRIVLEYKLEKVK
ncbi:MAG: hypothetical protein A2639_03030 [Candidatus Staskawiczbacteria bacterium RIFCSPHIGHO2_01_FULL_34_27]|uniref:Glycosyltransferase 2-like domain-containing protein n=1 Tax=Candidatus Staskawiczbacteria bacterium RIFCSPHIGHO2_01_FULL_34_27 TaxID=1802199 RepID=A0A1G2HKY5_9BACT|nr:MAG: hypothetical protein A2639_03030 [Candidatus Staskawiczbacteria bacterium RIFCSPHIGHO2_01_FULL_34_27]